MEIEIESKRNNPLLNRTEIFFIVKYEGEGTPTRELIRSELADKLNVKKENIIVNTIDSSFGKQEISGYAKVYSSLAKAKDTERDHFLLRNQLIEAEKKSEKKVEKPPEAPKEEPTEMKPAVPAGEAKPETAEEPLKEEAPQPETPKEEVAKHEDIKEESEKETPLPEAPIEESKKEEPPKKETPKEQKPPTEKPVEKTSATTEQPVKEEGKPEEEEKPKQKPKEVHVGEQEQSDEGRKE